MSVEDKTHIGVIIEQAPADLKDLSGADFIHLNPIEALTNIEWTIEIGVALAPLTVCAGAATHVQVLTLAQPSPPLRMALVHQKFFMPSSTVAVLRFSS